MSPVQEEPERMLEPFPDLEKPLPEDPPENALASVDELSLIHISEPTRPY